jgi:hypothetical protein
MDLNDFSHRVVFCFWVKGLINHGDESCHNLTLCMIPNSVHVCMSVCNAGFHYISVSALGVNSHDCWSCIIWWDLIQCSYKWNWVGLFNDNLRLNCKCLGDIITHHNSIMWYLFLFVESEVDWTTIFVHVSHIWNFMIESSVVYQCVKGL